MGVEPTTSSLGSWHSTAELRPLACNSKKPFPYCQTAAGRLGQSLCSAALRQSMGALRVSGPAGVGQGGWKKIKKQAPDA